MFSLYKLLQSRFPLIVAFVLGALIEGLYILYAVLNQTQWFQQQELNFGWLIVSDPLYLLPYALFIYVGLTWVLYLMKHTSYASYIPAFLAGIFLPSQPLLALFLLIVSLISAILIDRIEELDS